MTTLLLRARLADRPDPDPTRVELFAQALDGATLAGGIPAFDCNDSSPPLDPVNLLEFEHRDLKLFQMASVALLVPEPAIEIELAECEPRFDLYRRCHFRQTPANLNKPALRKRATVRSSTVGDSSLSGEKIACKDGHVLFSF